MTPQRPIISVGWRRSPDRAKDLRAERLWEQAKVQLATLASGWPRSANNSRCSWSEPSIMPVSRISDELCRRSSILGAVAALTLPRGGL